MSGNITKEKTENLQFRYLYGLGILFVVMSHCDGGGITLFSNWIHFGAFHLAIFVFGSGYFFEADKLKAPAAYLLQKVKKLLLPLWGWNLFYGVLVYLLHQCGFSLGADLTLRNVLLFPINGENLYELNMGSWFILPFFLVQFCYGAGKLLLDLCRKPQITDCILQAVFLVAGFAGVYLAGHGYHESSLYPVFRVLYFMPFYVGGILYRKFLEKQFCRIPSWVCFGGCLFAALMLNTVYGRTVYAIPSSCDYPFGVIATYLSGSIGILFWLKAAQILAEQKELCKPLAALGKNTWDIMLHQFVGIMAVKCFFAGANRLFGWFADFDFAAFYSDIWYLYKPKGIAEYTFLYVLGGLTIPILLRWAWKKVKPQIWKA